MRNFEHRLRVLPQPPIRSFSRSASRTRVRACVCVSVCSCECVPSRSCQQRQFLYCAHTAHRVLVNILASCFSLTFRVTQRTPHEHLLFGTVSRRVSTTFPTTPTRIADISPPPLALHHGVHGHRSSATQRVVVVAENCDHA